MIDHVEAYRLQRAADSSFSDAQKDIQEDVQEDVQTELAAPGPEAQ